MSTAPNENLVTRSTNWLAVVLAFASASGIVLALLGYGVALSVESRFGLPHTFTFNSSLDLFSLGTWAIADLLTGSSWSSWPFYKGLLISSKRVLLPALVMSLFGFLLLWAWLSASRALGRQNRQQKLRAARIIFKRNARQKSWVVSGSVFLVSSLIATLLVPAATFAVAVMTLVFCTVLATLPAMGLAAGQTHIDKWVVQPPRCHSNKPGAERKPGPAANCLSIKRADNSVEKGRAVFATSTSVVLYDPRTGDAKRLGIEGSVVTAVSELD